MVIPTTIVQELRNLQNTRKDLTDADIADIGAKLMISSKLTG
jgi:hypothetical protein